MRAIDDPALYGALSALLGPDDIGPGWIDFGGSVDVNGQQREAYYRRSFTWESGGHFRQLSLAVTVEESSQTPPRFVQPIGTVTRGPGNAAVQVIDGPRIGDYSIWESSLVGPIEAVFGLQAIAVIFQVTNTQVMIVLRSDDLSAQEAETAIAGWPW